MGSRGEKQQSFQVCTVKGYAPMESPSDAFGTYCKQNDDIYAE